VPAGSLVPRSTRAVAQFGSAPDWGSGGRGFKSRPPDNNNERAGRRVAARASAGELGAFVTQLSAKGADNAGRHRTGGVGALLVATGG
jgi:hypothetical protein